MLGSFTKKLVSNSRFKKESMLIKKIAETEEFTKIKTTTESTYNNEQNKIPSRELHLAGVEQEGQVEPTLQPLPVSSYTEPVHFLEIKSELGVFCFLFLWLCFETD